MKITYTFIMKVLSALLAALCWTSCSDFLEEDPKGQLPSDTYFSNKEDLDASLTALYSVIASSQASNNLCGTNFLVGDDISTHPSSNKQPLREHDQFDVKDNNSWLSSMWENYKRQYVQRQTDTHKICKFIVSDTLHNQISLITDRSKKAGRCSNTDDNKKRCRTYTQLIGQRQGKRKSQCSSGIISYQLSKQIGDNK